MALLDDFPLPLKEANISMACDALHGLTTTGLSSLSSHDCPASQWLLLVPPAFGFFPVLGPVSLQFFPWATLLILQISVIKYHFLRGTHCPVLPPASLDQVPQVHFPHSPDHHFHDLFV